MKGSKGKTAFCFPGQLQEKPILEDHHPLREDPHFKELLRRASSQTKFDLLNFSFGDEEEGEDFSLKLQIATYFLSMVHYYRLRAAGWNPDILAEHSMGIYAALAASGAVRFEEGLFITEAIGRLLKKEGAIHRGGMASIIGLPLEEVQKICQDLNGFQLSIANYNGSMHFVLSGEEGGVDKRDFPCPFQEGHLCHPACLQYGSSFPFALFFKRRNYGDPPRYQGSISQRSHPQSLDGQTFEKRGDQKFSLPGDRATRVLGSMC